MHPVTKQLFQRLTLGSYAEQREAATQLCHLLEKASPDSTNPRSELKELMNPEVYQLKIAQGDKNEIVDHLYRALYDQRCKPHRSSISWALGKAWNIHGFKALIKYAVRSHHELNENEFYQLFIALEDHLLVCQTKRQRQTIKKLIEKYHATELLSGVLINQSERTKEVGMRVLERMHQLPDKQT